MEEIQNKISKQIIVIRKDLNMRRGKQIAQGAHASLAVILNMMHPNPNESGQEERTLYIDPRSALDDWINNRFTKICVSVESLEELNAVYEKAKTAGILCALITDAGLTEFKGVPTVTCCAIGPAWAEEVDPITGHLKLL